MRLSITDNIPNFQKSPTCKRSLQVRRDHETICDAGRVSAEVAKTLALSEYKKYNTARLEQEAGQTDEDFDWAVRVLREKGELKRGGTTNEE
jgi:hypothetical protein